jgi:hypothetical protein
MKERPILFSSPMVRAILDGQKTQTRRVVKPQPAAGCSYVINGAGTHALHFAGERWPTVGLPALVPPTPRSADHTLACPYGKAGDRLWVRERYAKGGPHGVQFFADWEACGADPIDTFHELPTDETRWRPSIHMPRSVSRILLEVVSVRVERLHQVTNDGARAEGVIPDLYDQDTGAPTPNGGWYSEEVRDYLAPFAELWAAINGEASWDANPWVWVIEFRHIASDLAVPA